MRALIVVNPTATSTSARVRDVLASALASEFKIDVAETGQRGHAQELADQARTDGLDVVVVLGGDGTVGEVVNGLLAGGLHPEGTPALAVVPGGCTNVFARALGLPADPVEATAQLLEALRADRRRLIGLGRADDRYFTFAAGIGLDAAAVRRVEASREPGQGTTPWRYVRAAVREFYTSTDRRHPELSVAVDGADPLALHLALICNARPWSYLGHRPVVPCPQADFATGLDLFGLTRLRTAPTLRYLSHMLSGRERGPHGRRAVIVHDAGGVTVTSRQAGPFQLDGDYVGEREQVHFASVPAALRVVA